MFPRGLQTARVHMLTRWSKKGVCRCKIGIMHPLSSPYSLNEMKFFLLFVHFTHDNPDPFWHCVLVPNTLYHQFIFTLTLIPTQKTTPPPKRKHINDDTQQDKIGCEHRHWGNFNICITKSVVIFSGCISEQLFMHLVKIKITKKFFWKWSCLPTKNRHMFHNCFEIQL